MYAAFNLSINDWGEKERKVYYDIGLKIWNGHAVRVFSALKAFLRPNGKLDGEAIGDNWFPEVDADIFMSHSHGDQRLAIALAGWLSDDFKLKAFVDSCVWGCAYDLLKIVDREYCYNRQTQTYSYLSRNGSTSHVHMMLVMALSKMLDNTECVFFLNTPNSVSSKDVVSRTESPWIFAELGLLQIIRQKNPVRILEEGVRHLAKAELRIEYPVGVESLVPLDDYDCNKWYENAKAMRKHPLDVLYELFPPEE
ncbi:MAG TPA: hypothetical protein VMP11_04565 [Verrucomicrobiae bacterium]|nr:hypothetical protein [Verrucomicrobiae bacterium]